MDNIVFYKPLPASTSRPSLLGAVPATTASEERTGTFLHREIVSHHDQQSGSSWHQMHEPRGVSDMSGVEQGNLLAKRDSPNRTDNDAPPEIDELLPGVRRVGMLAGADSHRGDDDDNNGCIDMAELLPDLLQESVPTSTKSADCMVEWFGQGTQGGTSADSSSSTSGSSRSLVLLGDDEPAGSESDTDYSNFDVDIGSRSDSNLPLVAAGKLVDGGRFGSDAARTFDRLVTDHQGDDHNHDSVGDKTQRRLSAHHQRPVSADPASDTGQADRPQVYTDLTQDTINYETPDFDTELGGEGFGIAERDEAGFRSTQGHTATAASDRNPASNNDFPGPQKTSTDIDRAPSLTLAAASSHDLNMEDEHPQRPSHRIAARNNCRKRLRSRAPIRLAATARNASAIPGSIDLKKRKVRFERTLLDEECKLHKTNEEFVDEGNADDSDDEDYVCVSDATDSRYKDRPPLRKRIRRMKNRADDDGDVQGHPTSPGAASHRDDIAASSSRTQKSEKLPVHGYLTLKTVASQLVYCLTFSQDLPPLPQHRGRRQDNIPDCEHPPSSPLDTAVCQAPSPHQTMRCSRTSEPTPDANPTSRPEKELTEDQETLLAKMVHQDETWTEIGLHFPDHTLQSLKKNYFTKQGGKPRKRGRKRGTRTGTASMH